MKNVIKLSVISQSEAQGHAILKVQNGFVIMRGNDEGEHNLTCGNCDEVLAINVFHQQIRNIVFVCNRCGKHNIIRSDWNTYVFKYLKEEIDYPVLFVGLILSLLLIIDADFSTFKKILLTIIIFILSLFYKSLIQIFEEKKY